MKKCFSIHHFFPGLSLVFTLFVFAPVDLYLSYQEDLWFPLTYLLRWLIILAVAAFMFFALLSAFLPKKLSVAFRSALYACSFLAYLQGNLLLLDYGPLDGRAVNWSAYTLSYALNALLWIAVIALFIFLMFRFRQKFRRVLEIAACILLMTQVISISFFLIRQQGKKNLAESAYLSNAGKFTCSSDRNITVFVLDAFDSHLFEDLRQKYPDLISQSFEDFTFYYDTVGGASRTKYAIPFMLTGITNREEQSYLRYLSRSFESSPLIRELASGKYDSGLYTSDHYVDMTRTDAFGNIAFGVPDASSRFQLTKQFMQLVAFRYAPSVLSRYFWMYTGIFEQWKSEFGASASYTLNNTWFYQDLMSSGLKNTAKKPCFRFYHITGAHAPYKLNENIQVVPVGQSSEEQQAVGVLKIVTEYLSQLKALGVYDQTTVIVTADHGFNQHSSVEQSPLFMVKLVGSSHPFDTSDLPLSFADFPDILTSALRGTLTSMKEWKASSPRYFYLKSQTDSVVNIVEYAIDGPVWDVPAEKTGIVYHEDTLHTSRDYTLGTTLYFDERDTARKYCVSGISGNEGMRTWTNSHDAEMLFELSAVPGELKLSLDYLTYHHTQTVEVFVNDQLIETYSSVGSTCHVTVIPAGTVTGTKLRLRLHLPEAISPASLGNSRDKRLLALSLNAVTISTVDDP